MPNVREAAKKFLSRFDGSDKHIVDSCIVRWNDPDILALRAALEAETDRVSVPVGWQFRYVCGEDGYGPWQFTSDEHDASVYENNVSYETRRVYSLAAHERSRDGS